MRQNTALQSRVQQTETSFQILLDFRSVDEIVREEREHQHALERALQESRTSYEVISAISKIYIIRSTASTCVRAIMRRSQTSGRCTG